MGQWHSPLEAPDNEAQRLDVGPVLCCNRAPSTKCSDGSRELLEIEIDRAAALPRDGLNGTLVARVWLPGNPPGPAVVALR